MRNSTFLQLLIGIHVFLVVGHIYRHTKFVRTSFKRQRSEQVHLALKHKKQELISQLYALQDRNAIQKYAQEALGMKQTKLSQVKKISP